MKFQVSVATGCAGSFRKETSVEGRPPPRFPETRDVQTLRRIAQVSGQSRPPAVLPHSKLRSRIGDIVRHGLRGEELSSSLLGTWAHFANGSSRSRLCRTWLRNAGSSPVGGTFGGQGTCDEFLKFQPSPDTGRAGSYRKETLVKSAVIVATANDRAVTARERS